mmetsp:Transcript_34401/g.75306  ORF Transcript_34401/g.75306 Transcript_34401/m.75306 type:complete len:313 (+) Transcript_34401:357-1295(+)
MVGKKRFRQKKRKEYILTHEDVDLKRMLKGEDDISVVSSALSRTTRIKKLDLGHNRIYMGGNAGIKLVVDALMSRYICQMYLPVVDGSYHSGYTNGTLQQLILRNNNIQPEGAKYLAQLLCQSQCNLHTLDLGDNELGDEGTAYISDALQHPNCKLRTLLLRGNGIGRLGAAQLSSALSDENCKLQTLDLEYNHVGNDGLTHIADALRNPNCTVQSLSLYHQESHNSISNDGLGQLADALRYDNRTLVRLTMDGSYENDSDIRYKIARLVDINAESVGCGPVEVGRRKRAEFGPTVDEVYDFVRSKPYLFSG